jgi:hypothetical protein
MERAKRLVCRAALMTTSVIKRGNLARISTVIGASEEV